MIPKINIKFFKKLKCMWNEKITCTLWKKYLQMIHPIRNLYVEYKKKPYNHSKKKKKAKFKNRQAVWIDISLKKI